MDNYVYVQHINNSLISNTNNSNNNVATLSVGAQAVAKMSRAKQNKTSGDDDAGCRLPVPGWVCLGLSVSHSVKRVYAGF